MDIKEIQNLIRFVARSGATEVNLETEEFKINIKTSADQAAMPEQAVVQHVAQVIPAAPVAAAPRDPARLQPKRPRHLLTHRLLLPARTRTTTSR